MCGNLQIGDFVGLIRLLVILIFLVYIVPYITTMSLSALQKYHYPWSSDSSLPAHVVEASVDCVEM